MQHKYFTQPINSNGRESTLERILAENFESRNPFYRSIWLISAFTKYSGLALLSSLIRDSVNEGANINFILGVDLQGTSYEALLEVINLGVSTRIFKNRNSGHTFHPKIFVFEAPEVFGEIIIGSNNLTFGGLVSNYEAFARTRYDLQSENELFQQAKADLSRFLNPPENISIQLTQELIETMYQRGDIVSESQTRLRLNQFGNLSQVESNYENNGVTIISPFGTEKIEIHPRQRIRLSRSRRQSTISPQSISSENDLIQNRTLLWRKEDLPASDVQRQRGNPTGGLRLTQAGYIVDGQAIDQTTYFRNVIFGDLNWTIGENPPYQRETINLPVDIIIDDQNYGQHVLGVSHKPSGEADQGNYTTMLHWRDFASTIYDLDLRGKTFSIYSPLSGQRIPYLIVID